MAEPEKLITVDIATPDGLIYSRDGISVEMRAIDGQRTILYNHTPLLTPLSICEDKVTRDK